MLVYRTGLEGEGEKTHVFDVSHFCRYSCKPPFDRISKSEGDGLSEIVVSLSGRAANTQAVGGGQHSLSDG